MENFCQGADVGDLSSARLMWETGGWCLLCNSYLALISPTHSDYMGIHVYSTHIQSGIILGLESLHGLFVNKPDDVSTFDTNGGNW